MKLYLDTSIFGGYFDTEFRQDTVRLVDEIIKNAHKIMCSTVTQNELMKAPEIVRDLVDLLPVVEHIRIDEEILDLSELYIQEGILSEKNLNDAQHIAAASVKGANVIVSWDRKHMANFLKIRQYNAVNGREGYSMISIQTPTEVIHNL